jgi:hypothetical protein
MYLYWVSICCTHAQRIQTLSLTAIMARKVCVCMCTCMYDVYVVYVYAWMDMYLYVCECINVCMNTHVSVCTYMYIRLSSAGIPCLSYGRTSATAWVHRWNGRERVLRLHAHTSSRANKPRRSPSSPFQFNVDPNVPILERIREAKRSRDRTALAQVCSA